LQPVYEPPVAHGETYFTDAFLSEEEFSRRYALLRYFHKLFSEIAYVAVGNLSSDLCLYRQYMYWKQPLGRLTWLHALWTLASQLPGERSLLEMDGNILWTQQCSSGVHSERRRRHISNYLFLRVLSWLCCKSKYGMPYVHSAYRYLWWILH